MYVYMTIVYVTLHKYRRTHISTFLWVGMRCRFKQLKWSWQTLCRLCRSWMDTLVVFIVYEVLKTSMKRYIHINIYVYTYIHMDMFLYAFILFLSLKKKNCINLKVIVMNEISVFLIPFVLLLSFVPFLLPNHNGTLSLHSSRKIMSGSHTHNVQNVAFICLYALLHMLHILVLHTYVCILT